MIGRLSRSAGSHEDASRDRAIPAVAVRRSRHPEEHSMQWHTPTATDFRFGFEITMYVAAR